MNVWVRGICQRIVPFLICLSVMTGSFPVWVSADGGEKKLSEVAVFSRIELCHAGEGGQPLGAAVAEQEALDRDAKLVLHYEYKIEDNNIDKILPGIPYYLEVSPHLIVSTLSGSPLEIELEDGGKVQFGTLHADGQRAWVVFDQKTGGSGTVLSDYGELNNAYFYLDCARAGAPPQGETPVAGSSYLYVMKFENGEGLTFGYAEDKPVEAKAQIKKGGALTDRTITWTIQYTPWQNPSAADGVSADTPFELRDTIDTKLHEFVPGSARIDGWTVPVISDRSEITETMAEYVLAENTGSGTVISFGGTKFRAGSATQGNPPRTLTITYDTVIRDELLMPGAGSGKSVSNKAELFGGTDAGAANLGISDSSIVTVAQPVWLEKTGHTSRHTDGTGSETEWTVIFHPNGFTFQKENQLTLWDQLPDGSTLVDGSVTVGGQPQAVVTDQGNNSFTVSELKTAGSDITITYRTRIPEEMYDDGTDLGKNTGWFSFQYNGTEYTTPRKEVPVGSGDGSGTSGTAFLVKSNGGYDPATRTIPWNVTINPHKVNLAGATITDDLEKAIESCGISGHGSGLQLEGGASGVTVLINGQPPTDSSLVKLDYAGQKLTITVGNVGRKPITLSYATKVCDPCIFAGNTTKIIATNVVSTDDMKVETSGTSRSARAESRADVGATVLKKLPPVYDYAAGIMEWSIEVDEAGLDMSDIVLTDDLPEGLTYVPGSLRVRPEITCASADADGQKLEIRLGEVTEKTTVTFQTDVSPERLGFDKDTDVTIENTVRMTGQADQVAFAEVSHKIEQTFYNHGLLKSDRVDSQKELIQYEVLINPYGLPLPGNPSLEDTLDPRLQLDPDTLCFYKAQVSGTTAGKGQAPVYSKAGTGEPLTISDYKPDTNSFTVRLPIPAGSREAYVLTYTADIIERQSDHYSNSVHFEGGAVLLGGEKENQATVGGGGGGGGGGVASRKASIAITKSDSVDQTPLEGVTFTLYQWDEQNHVRGLPFAQGTTDRQGIVSFKVKPGAVYELVETGSLPGYGSAPGYTRLPAGVTKTRDGLLVSAGTAGSVLKLDLTNEAYTTDLVFRMMSSLGIPMAGETVILYDRDPDGPDNPLPLGESVVLADGTVRFSGIRRGASYYIRKPDGGRMIVEIPADIGEASRVRLPDGTVHTLTPDYQATGVVPPERQWELAVTKASAEEMTPLSGAVFGLYAEESCQTQLKTAVSDANGQLSFDGLLKGREYWIREITAPAGYIPDGAVCKVTDTDPVITIYNQKEPPGDISGGNGDAGQPDNPGMPGQPGGSDRPDMPGQPEGIWGDPGSSPGSGSAGTVRSEGSASEENGASGRNSVSAGDHPRTGDDGIRRPLARFVLSGTILTLLFWRGRKKKKS